MLCFHLREPSLSLALHLFVVLVAPSGDELTLAHMNDRMPTEIWLCVCDLLRPKDRLSVSQTCRSWRATALGMRSFWTSIEFVAKSNYDGCPPGQFRADAYTTRSNLPLFRDILQRSARLPLTISLHVHFGAEGVIPALVTALEPHAERLVALHYRGRAHHISALLDKLPGLAKLRSITTEGGMQYYDFYPFTQDASRLPSLERLVLAEKLLLPSPSAIFRALRSLSMTIPRLTYIHDIVSACPNLQQLRLNLGYAGENECRAVPGSLVDVLRPIPNIRFSGLSRGRLRNVLDGISVTEFSDVLQATLCNATLTISAHGSANRSRLVTLTSLGGSWSVTISQ